jgi:hypothetical protein
MEEHQTGVEQKELLAAIHNQLVDLKRVIVEIELARPSAGQALQERLRRVIGSTDYISNTGQSESIGTRERKVITPTGGLEDESGT